MRLLEYGSDGEFNLTRDFVGDNIPEYAILSHTWGADTEEVTYRDLIDGTGMDKDGYTKIRFCGEQARHDRLQYFWVDTCCIDKSNNNELSEAINSMFRWYRDAAKCYVFLSDVPGPMVESESHQLPWETAFQTSRWFKRGWTLQELIAPRSVEFFSKNGELLGDKISLERHICEITRVPSKALRGHPLAEFSVTERLSWAETRKTTREEDMAYSLLGTQREDFSVAFSLSNVSEVSHFVARDEELAEIHKKLASDGSRRTVVLHGLGGIGKTQLSIAYAIRHKDSYSATFWLNIKDEGSVKQSFARVAKQISREHPTASGSSSVDMKGDLDDVVDFVKAWLSIPNNTRWLMIYDNYDNPKAPGNRDPAAVDIHKFLPESYQGSVIITTRSSQVKIGYPIHVEKLEDVSDSLEILSSTSGREGLRDDPNAISLAKQLDGLPLALATAGAYLYQVTMSVSDYLRLYQESWAKLQKTSPELSSYEDRTLFSTWQISFKHVTQQNELSARLLRLWAYFDNQDLWFELLQHSDSRDPEWIRELVKDELSFHEVMRVLSNHGFVEADKSSQELLESRGYSIYGCVHSWTIHVLNQEWNYDLAKVALRSVALHCPAKQADRPWLRQRRLLQHAARCSYIVSNGLVPDDGMAVAYFKLGFMYNDQGKPVEAEHMYQRALQGFEKTLGPEHKSTLDTVNNLGLLYASWGKLVEAEQMYWRALQYYEKAWGPEHTSTLDTFGNLGLLYAIQGRLVEAEQIYQRVLQGKEKAWGVEHTSTLDTVNNLGILYKNKGKLAKAEQMFQQALQGFEKAWGLEHTSTLDTVNNLGNLYKNRGKLLNAEQMYQRALQGYEKAWGSEHMTTLKTVNNLGLLYADQGKLVEAEQMYQRALQGYEKAWGPEITLTLDTVNNLGLLYAKQGKLEKAEQMYQRALLGFERALGREHTSTLLAVNNLGFVYAYQGKLIEAEQMYQRALQSYEKELGVDNITTYIPALTTIKNLGALFERQASISKARIMYSKALIGYEEVYGPDYPTCRTLQDTLSALDAVLENGVPTRAQETVDDLQLGLSNLKLSVEETSLKSKQHKPLQKVGRR